MSNYITIWCTLREKVVEDQMHRLILSYVSLLANQSFDNNVQCLSLSNPYRSIVKSFDLVSNSKLFLIISIISLALNMLNLLDQILINCLLHDL